MISRLGRCAARQVAALALAFAAFVPGTAEATKVSPMILDLDPTGRGSVGRLELTNDGQRDLAYEVQMMSGVISPDGELALKPADDQFIVFPPQTIVEAQSQQVFRVQYVGTEALDKSQIYYLSVRQIPAKFDPGANQVQVLVNYNVLVNVIPGGAKASPVVRRVSLVDRAPVSDDPNAKGAPAAAPVRGLEFAIGNDGNRYFYAGRSNWTIAGRSPEGTPFSKTYSSDEMTRLIGVGVVGAGADRVFFIPFDQPVDPASVTVRIDP